MAANRPQRYYNPTLGRWTQQDSIERAGDPSQGNRYAYVGGDPVNGADPSGRCSFLEVTCILDNVEVGIAPVVAGGLSAIDVSVSAGAVDAGFGVVGVAAGLSLAVPAAIGAGFLAYSAHKYLPDEF